MKKVKVIQAGSVEVSSLVLADFSLFEEKMSKLKYFKEMKQNIDKSFILAAIDELALKDKRITAKRVKKICKKAVIKMIEEVEK
jgi:hypothetical protein